MDAAELLGQDRRRVAIDGQGPRQDLDAQRLGGPVSRLLHDGARLFAVLGDVGITAGNLPQLVRRQAPQAFCWWLQDAADVADALVQRADEGAPVERQHERPPDLRVVERRRLPIDQDVRVAVRRRRLARRLRRSAPDLAQLAHRELPGKGHVVAAGDETQQGGRGARDDAELDAVEVGLAGLEVVGIADQPHAVELLERVELEGTGADRLGAHVRARHVAGVDRREPGGQQHQQRGLRVVEEDRDVVVGVAVDIVDVAEPRAARIVLQLVARPAGQQLEGALDVARRERPAIVPFHAATQLEGELGLVVVPAPRFGEVGNDGVLGVARLGRVERDQIVEHRHERDDGGGRKFLEDRRGGRIVPLEHAKRAARLLRP